MDDGEWRMPILHCPLSIIHSALAPNPQPPYCMPALFSTAIPSRPGGASRTLPLGDSGSAGNRSDRTDRSDRVEEETWGAIQDGQTGRATGSPLLRFHLAKQALNRAFARLADDPPGHVSPD